MEKKWVTILGIDPGTRVTGYGVIQTNGSSHKAVDYGCIRTKSTQTAAQRYLLIFYGIEHLIEKYKPNFVSVENQFVQKNIQSAMKLSMARAVALVASAKSDVPIFEYAPRKAKQAVVGNGGASKEQVQKMVKVLLNLSEDPTPEDAADALALALCHAHSLRENEYV